MSKRMAEIGKVFEKGKIYTLDESIDILKKVKKTKFDESVEVHIRLGIDPKKTEQQVRGIVVMPHGIGKTKKVAVITKGEKFKEAEASGADFVGAEELIEKISKGWMDFDALIATPDTMKELSKLGKILGPKGLMPNTKSGTVTFEIAKAVKELKGGRIEYKTDEYGILHCIAGKVSFDKEKIKENIKTLIEAVSRSKPATSKGLFLLNITISSTMGPGIRVSPSEILQKNN